MKVNRSLFMLLLLLSAALPLQMHAQPTEADRKLLADIRAKAEKGDAQSQGELGAVFTFGHLGVAKDDAEAVKWYLKAADQNVAKAQFNLGVCYDDGLGVTKNEVEAVKWFRKAAEQDYAMAQFNLGSCYQRGDGVANDIAKALDCYRKAAEQGHVE